MRSERMNERRKGQDEHKLDALVKVNWIKSCQSNLKCARFTLFIIIIIMNGTLKTTPINWHLLSINSDWLNAALVSIPSSINNTKPQCFQIYSSGSSGSLVLHFILSSIPLSISMRLFQWHIHVFYICTTQIESHARYSLQHIILSNWLKKPVGHRKCRHNTQNSAIFFCWWINLMNFSYHIICDIKLKPWFQEYWK